MKRQQSMGRLALAVLALFLTGKVLQAEVLFGMMRGRWQAWQEDHDLAAQGRFFATSDYGFTPGEPDPYLKNAWGYQRFTRGQVTSELPAGSLHTLFPHSQPWMSGAERTLFGVAFEKPFVGDA